MSTTYRFKNDDFTTFLGECEVGRVLLVGTVKPLVGFISLLGKPRLGLSARKRAERVGVASADRASFEEKGRSF